jgi:hypothetical protein
LGHRNGGAGDVDPSQPFHPSALKGGGRTTAEELPSYAMWPASPTPALRQGTPRTHTRNCGNQPAHQSLITDVYRPCLLPYVLAAHRSPQKRRKKKLVSPLKIGHQSVEIETFRQSSFAAHQIADAIAGMAPAGEDLTCGVTGLMPGGANLIERAYRRRALGKEARGCPSYARMYCNDNSKIEHAMPDTVYQHYQRSYAVFIDPMGQDHIVIRLDANGQHDKMLDCESDQFMEVVARVEPWVGF